MKWRPLKQVLSFLHFGGDEHSEDFRITITSRSQTLIFSFLNCVKTSSSSLKMISRRRLVIFFSIIIINSSFVGFVRFIPSLLHPEWKTRSVCNSVIIGWHNRESVSHFVEWSCYYLQLMVRNKTGSSWLKQFLGHNPSLAFRLGGWPAKAEAPPSRSEPVVCSIDLTNR